MPPFRSKDEIIASLQSILEDSINVGVPGLSAAICSSRDTLWQSCAGLANFESQIPMNGTHLFGIGSITKLFTSIVTLQLVEEGRLKLLNTLGEILDTEVTCDIENAPEATLETLMSHTAGVDSWEDDPKWIVEGRGKKLDPSKIWGKAETLDYVRRTNVNGPKPGEWSYSNTNFTLLGLVIEKVTGRTAESEIRRRILEPLGMKHTYLEGYEEPPETSLPHRYHWATETFRKTAGICPSFSQPRGDLIDATGSNLSVEWLTGGMISSPSDLLKLAIGLRDGKVLGPSSMAFMKTWIPAKGPAEMGHGLFRFQSPLGYGSWLGHGGSVLGFTGALWWKEEGDCAISVLANIGTMHAGDVPSSAYDVAMNTKFLQLASELATWKEPKCG